MWAARVGFVPAAHQGAFGRNRAHLSVCGCVPLNPTGKELIQLWKNLPELLRIVRAGRMDRLDAALNAALDPQPI